MSRIRQYARRAALLLAGGTLPLLLAAGLMQPARAGVVSSGDWPATNTRQPVKIPADQSDQGSFGIAVDLTDDGTTALVGAQQHGFNRGGAYVFQRVRTAWQKTADLTPGSLPFGASFGNAVAISADGTVAMVGEVGWQQLTGRVLVFRRTAQGWVSVAKLMASDPATFTHFGNSISMDAAGDRVVVGALGADGFVGRAYVFTRQGLGEWAQTAELQPERPAGQLDFGTSVSMSRDGSTILVGANVFKQGTGAAYLFEHAADGWSQEAMLTATYPKGGAYFGTAVALDATGSTALIGAVYENDYAGAAYLFRKGGSGWTQAARLAEPGTGQFGNAVALSDDGTVGAVGSQASEVTGTAYVYSLGASSWARRMTLRPNVSSRALYGVALGLDTSGEEVVVGAAFDDNGQPTHSGFGAVYIVPVVPNSTCVRVSC